jgi:hypothetical protein
MPSRLYNAVGSIMPEAKRIVAKIFILINGKPQHSLKLKEKTKHVSPYSERAMGSG